MRMHSLSSIFDRGANKLQSYNDYPLPRPTTFKNLIACKNIQQALAMIHDIACAEGQDPTSYPVVVDTNSSTPARPMTRYTSALTRARGNALAWWSLQHGRKLTASELMRVQGVAPGSVVMNVSPQQMGALLGNAFTKPVMDRTIDQAIAAWSSGLDLDTL